VCFLIYFVVHAVGSCVSNAVISDWLNGFHELFLGNWSNFCAPDGLQICEAENPRMIFRRTLRQNSVIKLRPAELSDFEAIARLHVDNWRTNYRGILSDNYLDNEIEKDRLETWSGRLTCPVENQIVTIATQDNTFAGFCCLYLDDDPTFGSLIDNLHVPSTLQKSGIGKMLVIDSANKVYDKAKNKKMYLWVYEANKNARIVYDKLGGRNFETIDKENPDGTKSKTCRIVWDDLTKIKLQSFA
jgi:ribosomal protein S18 acetylase RimI-like enzyme